MEKKKVLITGGSGLIGQKLSALLQDNGYKVAHLSRCIEGTSPYRHFQWDVEKQKVDNKAFDDLFALIHLAGANVGAGRWTDSRKREIMDSRVKGTRLLQQALAKQSKKPELILSASAIGFYGIDTGAKIMDEKQVAGEGFLADVCKQWEEEADKLKDQTERLIKLRLGVVLSKKGGALEKIAQPVRFGLGAPLGSGKQFMSWIHLEDLCEMILFALDKGLKGTFNAVSSQPVTNAKFTKTVASTLKKPYFLPRVPAFVLRLALGEMADIVLGGNYVSNDKIKDQGFIFRYDDLDLALKNLLLD